MIESLEFLPPGARGTKRTLERMAKLALEDSRKFAMINIASDIIRAYRCPSRDKRSEASAFMSFLKRFVHYVSDPITTTGGAPDFLELVQSPLVTLKRRAGDCDDMSTLLAALLLCVGIRPKFVAIKSDPRRPDEFSHVYVRALINGSWLGMDATVPGSYLGWEPKAMYGEMEWRI